MSKEKSEDSKEKQKEEKSSPLCFRCEYRALFLETGKYLTKRCGNIKETMFECNTFLPCKPLVLKRPKRKECCYCMYEGSMYYGDYPVSELLPGRFGAKEIYNDCKMKLHKIQDGYILYWEIKNGR